MKKSDLKSGMIVETREEKLYLVVGDKLIGECGYLNLSSYQDDLKHTIFRDFNIRKVYNYKYASSFSYLLKKYDNLELVWESKGTKLTDKEIEILKTLKTLGFEFLARDYDDYLYAYNVKPYKVTYYWDFNLIGELEQSIMVHNDVFKFITWSDDEPTNINELLKMGVENE